MSYFNVSRPILRFERKYTGVDIIVVKRRRTEEVDGRRHNKDVTERV